MLTSLLSSVTKMVRPAVKKVLRPAMQAGVGLTAGWGSYFLLAGSIGPVLASFSSVAVGFYAPELTESIWTPWLNRIAIKVQNKLNDQLNIPRVDEEEAMKEYDSAEPHVLQAAKLAALQEQLAEQQKLLTQALNTMDDNNEGKVAILNQFQVLRNRCAHQSDENNVFTNTAPRTVMLKA